MRLSGWDAPFQHLSASAISLLITCPEQFRLRRIKRIPETWGIDKFIGSVDHKTHQENFTQKIVTAKNLTIEDMAGAYHRTWDKEYLESDEEPDFGDKDPVQTREHGWQMVEAYHDLASPSVQPINVEERFEVRVPDVPIPVVGYTDVETKETLIERKTTGARLKKPKAKWLTQGRIYSMAYAKPVEWHVVTKQVTPQVITPYYEPGLRLDSADHDATALMIQQAAYTLNDLWLRYGPDTPWPVNGLYHDWACSYCSFGPSYGKNCVAWKGSA